MTSLYNLRSDYAQLLSMIYDGDHDEQTILDTLEAIEDTIEDKAHSYGVVIRNLDSDIDAIKAEENRLKQRRMALERSKESMKANLFDAMKGMGRTEIKTPLFSFNIQKNGGKRALVLDVPPEELPEAFQKVQIVPDNEALRQWLDGAEDNCPWCHLAPQGEILRIR